MRDGSIHIHCPVRDKPHSVKHKLTLLESLEIHHTGASSWARYVLSAASSEGKFKAMKQKFAKFIIISSMAYILVINETLLFICVLGMDYEPL